MAVEEVVEGFAYGVEGDEGGEREVGDEEEEEGGVLADGVEEAEGVLFVGLLRWGVEEVGGEDFGCGCGG